MNTVDKILESRKSLKPEGAIVLNDRGQAAEGGCGVIGMACSEQIAGKHLLQSLDQMRNRGNGKGGGIAMVGLVPDQFGVSQQVMDEDYLLAVAYLDPKCRQEVEEKHIHPTFEVDHVRVAPHMGDYKELPALEVCPPEIVQYFVRVKGDVVEAFQAEHQLELSRRQIEDEIVYQNTFRLNNEFYASTGETRAFVMSHGKNLLVLKAVAYAEDVVRYYQLEEMKAHVWIGHHRYPTKGRVWHPGGAHPFIGLNEALVHNGDFANYASIAEYLSQRNIHQLFLTDTEVSVQVFDLLYRTYNYPLEYVIEALAPTTERDFTLLSPEKQRIYEMLQVTHMHNSPDGPWFFIIAQSDREEGKPAYRLTSITDTSMLRPQVFALQQTSPDGPAIGFAASEKQGIDAALQSLASEDDRFWGRADRYWNARGGSHTDGGAFIFTVHPQADGSAKLVCADKFGQAVTVDTSKKPYCGNMQVLNGHHDLYANGQVTNEVQVPEDDQGQMVFQWVVSQMPAWGYGDLLAFLETLLERATDDAGKTVALDVLTLMLDRRYGTGNLRRSSVLALVEKSLTDLFALMEANPSAQYGYVTREKRTVLLDTPQTVVVDARGYEPEGPHSVALELVGLAGKGFRKFMVIHGRGHRFIGNGFGADSAGIRIDVYGSSGDYLASGIDGMTVVVHGNAQDQLAQIMKAGTLVVHGDVGQTFGYAAKGGEAYVLGNAAGRPLINAVGKPRVVINGTCLDYLAESFMAGNPLNGGGFVVLNGIEVTDEGVMEDLPTPYPGGNLFSLASGGAIYVRDPYERLTADQLNGGEFYPFTQEDWALIEPYLAKNAEWFGIEIEELLTVDGRKMPATKVYRKIAPAKVQALSAEAAWVNKK